ncbi:MAG: hypothetical protein Q8942_13130 [Bacillota bacterium]|nr:hypothetical protein [Bacillota bacterium]
MGRILSPVSSVKTYKTEVYRLKYYPNASQGNYAEQGIDVDFEVES